MKRINNKGFSLVELLVTMSIIGVLAAMLAPALTSSIAESKKDMDKASLNNLTQTIQMGMQHSSVYTDAKKIADGTHKGQIVVKYDVDRNNIVTIDSCEITDKFGLVFKDSDDDMDDLEAVKESLKNYVNGKIEPIELKSKYYQDCDEFRFIVTFPDVDFRVNVELEIEE